MFNARWGDYVDIAVGGGKQAVAPAHRSALERGAPGVVIDHAGALPRER